MSFAAGTVTIAPPVPLRHPLSPSGTMRRIFLSTAFTVLVLSGCAAASAPGEGGSPSGGSADLITSEELRETDLQDATVWDAVQRLRPAWLRSRGTTGAGDRTFPRVFLDGVDIGDLDELRRIGTRDVREIRFMNSRDATTRYGTGYPGGAILVRTRR